MSSFEKEFSKDAFTHLLMSLIYILILKFAPENIWVFNTHLNKRAGNKGERLEKTISCIKLFEITQNMLLKGSTLVSKDFTVRNFSVTPYCKN